MLTALAVAAILAGCTALLGTAIWLLRGYEPPPEDDDLI